MEKVFVVEMTYFDETNGQVSTSTSVHKTEQSAVNYLKGEVEYTLEHFKDMGAEVHQESELSAMVTWNQGYYEVNVEEKIVNE